MPFIDSKVSVKITKEQFLILSCCLEGEEYRYEHNN